MNDFPAALPRARTPDPRSAPGLRWGVLGTGWIADKFVSAGQAAFEPAHRRRRLTQRRERNRVRSAVRHRHRIRQLRGAGGRPGRRRRVRRDAPQRTSAPRVVGAGGRKTHRGREATRTQCDSRPSGSPMLPEAAACSAWRRTGPRSCRNTTSCVNYSRRHCWARSPRWSPTSASGSPPAIAFTGRSWRVDRCLISATYLISFVLGVIGTARPHRRIGHHDRHRRHGANRHPVEPPRSAGRPAHHASWPTLRRGRPSPVQRRPSKSTGRSTSRADSP